ncbi:hypothetical protein GTO89_01535 [Heliobacterium gestii]|uniref:Uncharacterized protein n=1 Tax=Heliomicrobium gestii TaxID=2699 RepID=A0A845L534_HELGE|nr:hypothetical protein [Heliomicrobium gestii]MBM7865458.1 hypothetical protein [Heliomicrobium gestii]MZP41712.1 hypothetical protein [Heliomicrobium gestii]
MNPFCALVANDLKLKKARPHSQTLWWKAYMAMIGATGIALFAYAILRGFLHPEDMLSGIPFLLFLGFGLSIRTLKQEWHNGTVSWWLALPYSRTVLLGAKAASAFVRFLYALASTLAVFFLFTITGLFLRPDIWNGQSLHGLVAHALPGLLLLLVASSLPIMLGIVWIVVSKSRLRPVLPAIWLAVIALGTFIPNYFFPKDKAGGISRLPERITSASLIEAVAFMALIAVLCFVFSSYVLERHVEV